MLVRQILLARVWISVIAGDCPKRTWSGSTEPGLSSPDNLLELSPDICTRGGWLHIPNQTPKCFQVHRITRCRTTCTESANCEKLRLISNGTKQRWLHRTYGEGGKISAPYEEGLFSSRELASASEVPRIRFRLVLTIRKGVRLKHVRSSLFVGGHHLQKVAHRYHPQIIVSFAENQKVVNAILFHQPQAVVEHHFGSHGHQVSAHDFRDVRPCGTLVLSCHLI